MTSLNEIFSEIDAAFRNDPALTKGVEATYQFDLEEEGQKVVYQLILRGAESHAAPGDTEKPDCTMRMTAKNFEKMVNGKLNGTMAVMSGRLKLKGSMGLALKLQDILDSYNAARQSTD